MENKKWSVCYVHVPAACCLVLFSALSLLCASGFAQSNPNKEAAREDDSSPSKSEKARRLELMRKLAESVSISEIGGDDSKEVKRIAKPLFRYDDSARGEPDGAIWAWGSIGRPAALLVVYKQVRARKRNDIWRAETVSLSNHRIRNVDRGGVPWESRSPGLRMQLVPNAPLPNGSAARRERQLRRLARRFSAYEEWDNAGRAKLQRFTLRLLPEPIHRYADPQQGLDAGGLFLFSYGVNPEIVMVLEARRNDEGRSQWQYGFGRISAAALYVLIDGEKEVWSEPIIRRSSEKPATYFGRRLKVARVTMKRTPRTMADDLPIRRTRSSP